MASQTDLFDVNWEAAEASRARHQQWCLRAAGPIGETCGTCHFLMRGESYAECVKAPREQKGMMALGSLDAAELHAREACQKWSAYPDHEPLALTPPGFTTAEVREAPLIAADWWEEYGDTDKAAKLREIANQ